jgi:hypothetical protein
MIELVSRPEARPVTCSVLEPLSEERLSPLLEVEDETELEDM